MEALRMLTEQLWGPGLGDRVRVEVVPHGTQPRCEGWRTVEEYWLLGSPASPRLLVPVADGAVQRAALTHYRGLRKPAANAARAVLGTLAGARAPLSRNRVVVQVSSPEAAALLPLRVLADALGHPRLHATFGVRVGANRKATLQLLDDAGASVGYAKLGWNTTANEYVRNESSVLAELSTCTDTGTGAMQAPALLAALEQGGRPIAVIAPLPADVRGARGSSALPSSREFYALAPVIRTATAGSTVHAKELTNRLFELASAATSEPAARNVLDAARALATLVSADTRTVPVQARWHGDLTPWNCARQRDGQLWAWDWESSERDVVAGLDVLHWHFSVAREAGNWQSLRLADCTASARAHLAAAGTSASALPVVQAVYALTVVERAATLAARDGGWERVWITPERLGQLVAEARQALVASLPGH